MIMTKYIFRHDTLSIINECGMIMEGRQVEKAMSDITIFYNLYPMSLI